MRPSALPALLIATALAAGCNTSPPKPVSLTHETFDSSATFTRDYVGTPQEQACESARRALLSQGYLVATATKDFVNGRKSFQPERELHVEIDLRITCVADGDKGQNSTVFASAVQDRYALKKSSTSASVGVSVLGSVSVPFSSSDDSLVKVASETIGTREFYDRLFALIDRNLEKSSASP